MGRVTGFLDDDQTGSDDTEYALFNARLLLKHGAQISAEAIAGGWREEIVSASNTYKGAGFSEMLAIRNLQEGLRPPQSGRHLHAWSDGLAMRVAPFGIVAAGRPELAARLAEMDGSVTHAGEGIFAGQAVAAAIARAMEGTSVDRIVDAALGVIPPDSWTSAGIQKAVNIGAKSPTSGAPSIRSIRRPSAPHISGPTSLPKLSLLRSVSSPPPAGISAKPCSEE